MLFLVFDNETDLNIANFFRCLKFTRTASGGNKLIRNWCLEISEEKPLGNTTNSYIRFNHMNVGISRIYTKSDF